MPRSSDNRSPTPCRARARPLRRDLPTASAGLRTGGRAIAAKRRGCSHALDSQERTRDMSVDSRQPLPRIRTMCAAFLVFAATAAIPRVAAATSVPVCHVPPGNSANAHVITVGEAALPAHLAHGDSIGPSCGCQATEGASCGANQAPCCAGLKCVADLTGVFTCQAGTSSNPLPPGNACTNSTQCDALNPCTSIGTNDSVCGG